MSPQATSISDLSLQLLTTILSRLSTSDLLRSAACVSSSWRTAAATAIEHIHCSTRDIPSLQQWLAANHCHAAVQCIEIVDGHADEVPELQLPVQHLQQLTRLKLHGLTVTAVQSMGGAAVEAVEGVAAVAAVEAVEHPSGLAPLTALRELIVRQCDISLQGLSALTALQHLDIISCAEGAAQTSSAQERHANEIAAALPVLQHLTTLWVERVACQHVAEQLHSLPSLQRLMLGDPCTANLQQLPTSLTHLELWGWDPEVRVAELSPTATPGLSQLTGLKILEVHAAPPFSVGLLSSMTGLHELILARTQLTGPGSLSVLTGLTQLKHLKLPIRELLQPVLQSTADTAAITASSQLTHLDITGSFTSCQEVDPMFRDKQLPDLEVLCASMPVLHDWLRFSVVRMCCTNVKQLRLSCPDVDEPDMVAYIANSLLMFAPGPPYPGLATIKLDVGGYRMGPVFGVLGDMHEGLRCLHINGLVAADLPGMLQLATCSRLTELWIETARQPLERSTVVVDAVAGHDGITNISQQLHELLRDAMLEQRGNIDPDQLRTLLTLEAKLQRRQRQEFEEVLAEVAEVGTSAQQQVANLQQKLQQTQQQLQEAQQQQVQLQQQVKGLQHSLAEVLAHIQGTAARQP